MELCQEKRGDRTRHALRADRVQLGVHDVPGEIVLLLPSTRSTTRTKGYASLTIRAGRAGRSTRSSSTSLLGAPRRRALMLAPTGQRQERSDPLTRSCATRYRAAVRVRSGGTVVAHHRARRAGLRPGRNAQVSGGRHPPAKRTQLETQPEGPHGISRHPPTHLPPPYIISIH
jgi:hypothetical protein